VHGILGAMKLTLKTPRLILSKHMPFTVT
jgi:hypothetical protein